MSDPTSRVLWLIKGLGQGGAEQLLVEHASAGGHDDLTFEVAYVLSWKTALVDELGALGVAVHPLGVRRLADLRWVWRLWRLLRDGRYDVVHAHSPQVAVVARLLIRLLPRGRRPAFVSTEHNVWGSHRWATRTANRLTFRWNDDVLAVSDDVDSITSGRDGVVVLEHGIDLDRVGVQRTQRAAVRAELGVGDEVLAVTVANLRATKNYPGLLDAARLVVDRGLPVRFVAAGQGPLEAQLRARVTELGLDDHFRFLGYRADATRILAAADLFVLASDHEGLPLAMMEAFALDVPVIATAVGGLRTAIVTDDNGILVAAGDPEALADAIERAVDPELRARLAAGARRSALDYSSARSAAIVNDLYRSHVR